ncbi:hypothetical protein BH10CYA1_BH10CYA1_23920 [soil metagenome]
MTNKHLERAVHLMHKRPQLAAKELRLALSDDPNNAYLHALLAACCLDYGNKEEALTEIRQAIAAAPTEPLGFQILAHYHLQEVHLLEAEVAIEEAIQLNPNEPHYWGVLANIELQNENLSRALEAAETGLECDPEHVHCHNLRALILTRMGKSDQAKDSLDTALEANPESALTHAYRGWTFLEKHRNEESQVHFREALRLDPTMEWARLGLIKSMQQCNWAYQWHRKLKTKLVFAGALVWFALNFYLIGVLNKSPAEWHLMLTILSFISWALLMAFATFTFLPYELVAEPLLRFRMQFDPEGKLVLTREEQTFNRNTSAFLISLLFSVTLGIVTGIWWTLVVSTTVYVATLPFGYPQESRRDWTVWTTHSLAAVAIGTFIFLVSAGKGNPYYSDYGVIGFNTAFCQFLFKGTLGASLVKALFSSAGAKGLASALGLGGAGALQSIKDKQKQKVRTHMLSDRRGSELH